MNNGQHAQTFAILTGFVLVHYYGCSGLQSMAFAAKLLPKKSSVKRGGLLARWFLLWYGDSFGVFETKQVFKYLAGRKSKEKREKRELSHYKPGEFTRKLRKTNAKSDKKQTDFGF